MSTTVKKFHTHLVGREPIVCQCPNPEPPWWLQDMFPVSWLPRRRTP